MTESTEQQGDAPVADKVTGGRVRPFGSLAYTQYRLMFSSFIVGFLGFQMRQVINLWLVYDISESALSLGLLGLFQFLPMLVLGLVGGSLAPSWR